MSNAEWLDDGTLMWPHITSPLARRVLAAVFYKVSEPMTGSPEKPGVNFGAQHELKLRKELRAKLHNSGLAQAIAAGPDSMPSRFDYLPRWQQLISKHNAPKTLEQLAIHVMFNLDWYLDNPKPASMFHRAHKITLWLSLSFACSISGFMFRELTIGIIFLLIAVLIFVIPALADSIRGDVDLVKQSEFYLYLLECYGESDSEDELPDSPEIVR